MKLKTLIIYILFLLFVSPILVNAEECKQDDIKIERVELNEIKGNAEESASASTNNNQINLNTKMNVIGDSLTYKVVIKNTSNSDYVFDKNQITKDYINYDISYEDDSNIVKAGEEKIIYLRLNYQNKPQVENLINGILTENNKVSFNLINETGEIINPKTKNKIIVALIITTISIGFTILLTKRRKKLIVLMMIISLLVIPKIVNAICTCTLDINLNLEIDAKEAMFLSGKEVNEKLKELAGNNMASVENIYTIEDQNITAIRYSETEPNESEKQEKNVVSTSDSGYPIYMWFDNGTIYWWSEDKTPSLNEDMEGMFYNLKILSDISGIKNFDSSNTKILSSFFGNTNISSLIPVKNWNTSQVTSLRLFIGYDKSLVNTEGIENWDVSKVTTIAYMFWSCYGLEEVNFKNWKTDSLTEMEGIFAMTRDNGSIYYDGSIKHIYLSELFNTSQVTSISSILAGQDEIEDYSFLQYFDTSKVTNFNGTFINNLNLVEDTYFKNWDVTSADNFHVTFSGCKNIKKMDLRKWNPKELTDLRFMFTYNESLEEIDISSLDTSKVTQFWGLFNQCTKLKHIYVGEKWDTSANTARTDGVFPSNCELPNFSRNNPNFTDLSYAHTGEGGYLTLKINNN